MAKKSHKRRDFPKIHGIQFRKKIPHSAGLGRYLGRLTGSDEDAEILCLVSSIPSQLSWAERMASADSDAWPTVLGSGNDDTPWIAFRTSDGQSMEEWLASHAGSVSEIQALNVVMQIAVSLHSAHGFGIPHGRLSPSTIYLKPTAGDLEEVELVGWAPLPDTEYEKAQQDDLKALGQLLYQLITGVLPPSAQTAEDEQLEGDSAGAFDDVLMDWIDEDRDLKGLGKPAIEALTDSGSFKSVLAFIEALQPHFSEHLKTTIQRTGDELEEDRSFMMEVERQRSRLKELETRQRFIRDWLGERLERIDQCESELERQTSRLKGLENLQTQIDLSLGATLGLGQNQAIADVLSSWTPGEEEEPILLNDEVVLSVEPPPVPPILSDELEEEPDPFGDDDLDGRDTESEGSIRLGLIPSMLIIFALVAIGGVGAAYLTRPEPVSNAQQTEKNQTSPVAQTSQRDGRRESVTNPAISIPQDLGFVEEMHREPIEKVVAVIQKQDQGLPKIEPTVQATPTIVDASIDAENISDVGVPPSADTGVASAHLNQMPDTGIPDASLDIQVDAASPKVAAEEPAQPTKDVPEAPAAAIPPPPEGMVTVQGGELWLGVNEAQANSLVRMCFYDRARFNQNPCNQIEDEVTQEKKMVSSFYMDKTEVSQKDFNRCKRSGGCKQIGAHWDDGKQPATGMTYHHAKRYCEWRGARLPTHEEWFYAARGPKNTRIFPWGDQTPFKAKPARANHGRFGKGGGLPDRTDRNKYAGPVTILSDVKSPFGAINLVGNVREWTATQSSRGYMVVGGGWRSPPHRLRLTRKESARPNTHMNDIGFRCVQSIEASP